MKKRLLALALCLVLATSLLPVSAAADTDLEIDSISFSAGNLHERTGGGYQFDFSNCTINGISDDWVKDNAILGKYDLHLATEVTIPGAYGLEVVLFKEGYDLNPGTINELQYSTDLLSIDGWDCIFGHAEETDDKLPGSCTLLFAIITGHQHKWKITKKDSTLTAACTDRQCTMKPVTLTLTADSVTLPDSPFNARLEGQQQFEKAVTGVTIGKIRYDYKDADGVWHKDVNPVAANAKAGTYQAFVQISNLPVPVDNGLVAMAENQDGANTAELYVQYTAVDPAITAQTGDNRPIELMLAGLVVFAALAAAAFALDSKRKYSR